MTATDVWTPIEGNRKEIIREFREPLLALARGEVPALVLRGAYDPRHCSELIERMYDRGILYDPHESAEENPHFDSVAKRTQASCFRVITKTQDCVTSLNNRQDVLIKM